MWKSLSGLSQGGDAVIMDLSMQDRSVTGSRLITEVADAVALLRGGAVVALPTETVYGLAASADHPDAVERVFALKGRPASNPLILHVSDLGMLAGWTPPLESRARRLGEAFWPGPLTLVLPALERVSRRVTAGQATVAVRVPAHPLIRDVIAKLGTPLVAPSANLSTRLSPTSPGHVLAQFRDQDLAVLDGGPCSVGLESTIVSLLPGQQASVLRPGILTASAIADVLGEPVRDGGSPSVSGAPRVPGQMRVHYAPRQPLRLCAEPADADLANPRCGWITAGLALVAAGPVRDLGREPMPFARDLYATLHELEACDLDVLVVLSPPDEPEWRAIHDRLGRASADRFPAVGDAGA
ncbi:MAG: L-threonylcarbamoyladenylate synthase [Candidatus Sericytochromatia bacterium]|nr:L-threonylcarbamoyladenylate synthase [Candidatus Sericytochromatia bacterium]